MMCARAQRGFTLMEVLVALVLMAILSLVSWRALDSVVTTQERLDARAQDLNSMVHVLGQLQYDLERHANRDVFPRAGAAGDVLPPGIRVVVQDRSAPLLALIRAASDGTWQQVFWILDGNVLRRSVGLASSALPLPFPETQGDAVLTDVAGFTVRAWLPGSGWIPLPMAATGARNTGRTRGQTRGQQASAQATGVEIVIERRQGDEVVPWRKVVLL